MSTYITKDDQQYGPYEDDQLHSMLNDGSLLPTDLAWREGMSEWVTVRKLAPDERPVQFPPVPPQQAPQPEGVALWNPNTAANWSLVFWPAFGSLLHHLNWKALGNAKEAATSLIWCAISLALYVILFIVPLNLKLPVLLAHLVVLVLWNFSHAKKQTAFVRKSFRASYTKKSFAMPVLAGLGVYAIVIGSYFLIGPSLPEVDSPEVVALVEQVIQESPESKLTGQLIGKVKITNPGEVSYDSKKPRRVARAELRTNLGREVIYYSVEWHNKSKGIIWVQIEDEP